MRPDTGHIYLRRLISEARQLQTLKQGSALRYRLALTLAAGRIQTDRVLVVELT